MTKLVIIPDLHLQESLVLPLITQTLKENGIQPDKYLFIGDYFDQWQVNDNRIIQREIQYLKDFAATHSSQFILGNHDLPYITTEIESYSNHNMKAMMAYQRALTSLNGSLAHQDNDWLFSHAGLTQGQITDSDIVDINDDNFDVYGHYLNAIQHKVSYTSGGWSLYPSLVWARPEDWYPELNTNYHFQVVGHTPVATIDKLSSTDEQRAVYFVDTFSLKRGLLGYLPIGDGSFIVIDTQTNQVTKLTTNWNTIQYDQLRHQHFNVN